METIYHPNCAKRTDLRLVFPGNPKGSPPEQSFRYERPKSSDAGAARVRQAAPDEPTLASWQAAEALFTLRVPCLPRPYQPTWSTYTAS